MADVSWLAAAANVPPDFDHVFALLPGAHDRFRVLMSSLREDSTLGPDVLGLCGLRVYGLLGADPHSLLRDDMERLPSDKRNALYHYATASVFSPAERSCIAFCEQYVLDPHGFTDEDFVRLHDHLDDKQIAMLTLATAVFDATARFQVALGIECSNKDPAHAASGQHTAERTGR